MKRLAIITSHPIQYHAPWFRFLAMHARCDIAVFYLWDFGVTLTNDAGFGHSIQWDVPLLSGYKYEFIKNVSANPGTHRFWGLRNPSLFQRIEAYDPDAVLVIGYKYASLCNFLWRWHARRAPLLFRGDSHRICPQPGLSGSLRKMLISRVFRRFSAFLNVGIANSEYFRYHGVDSQKLFFAPHAVDNDRFMGNGAQTRREAIAWKQALAIPNDHSLIVFAGKLESKKRPFDLLRGFVQAGLSKAMLLFVGAGTLERELRNAANGDWRIKFAPFQNQSCMPRVYAAADVVVLPSFGPGETWGLAVNEAMCLSRPVIVSNHVGCSLDLVHSNENGLIFRAGDVDQLADCLRQALSDRERLSIWGKESRRIIEGYSYTHTTRGLKRALEHVGLPGLLSDGLSCS